MLVDARPPKQRNYKAHLEICTRFGAKAAGLVMLPPPWRLDFAALSVDVHGFWQQHGRVSETEEIAHLKSWLCKKQLRAVIIRSSGVSETLYDRGKFRSIALKSGWTLEDIEAAIVQIFRHAQQADGQERLGVVIQEFVDPDFVGHLSNEHRVSPTINQWSYELEKPRWSPSRGINSKLTTSPDPRVPLRCGNKVPHQPLRSVAHYLVSELQERCHLEWIVSGSTLYLAQIDFEWPEHDVGLNPKKDIEKAAPPELDLDRATRFQPYVVGAETSWPKLRNLSDFDFDRNKPAPRIYPLSPRDVKVVSTDSEFYRALSDDMLALTGNRLVVRTDCIQKGAGHFNLPRTDTVNVKAALDWCNRTIEEIEAAGITDDNYIFLFHAFLPALSSAWAYAKPGNPIVIVDALWGLPDGLQVLPVDTYEVNVVQQQVVQTKSTFKPRFLTELPDGTWDYRNIRTRSGRSQVLSNADKLEIATRTRTISDKLDDEAQIMWFCDIPDVYKVGRNLPWFRSREKFDPAPRQEVQYRPFLVTKPEDLDHLPPEKVIIHLSPEANLIRDDDFLNLVVEIAKKRELPVQLEGSILGHIFYKLNQEGIPVVLSNAPKYYRKRNRRVFGKIVRDKIPANIAAGGEAVREARLAKADVSVGLAGKLVEEVEELLKAPTSEDEAAELSDMLEVVKGLASAHSIDWSKVERLAEEKAGKRGGFRDGRVLIETTMPHRDSPLEHQEQVSISDLGAIDCTETQVEIPSTSLLATARGPGIIFSFEGDPSRFRVSIRQGKLYITKLDKRLSTEARRQRDLFDFD